MFDWRSPAEWKRLWRYYQAGIVNLLFGYGLYALLVRFGLDMYLAQLLSHVTGVAFNYFTYSRYAFAGTTGSKLAFVGSYAVNYALSVVFLIGFAWVIALPYLSGLLSTIVVSLINFLLLKRFVFREVRPTA